MWEYVRDEFCLDQAPTSIDLVAMARFGARFTTAALALVLNVGPWHVAMAQAQAQAQPCAKLSGPEALTCQWKEDSEKCIQQKCQDMGY